jgi:hypothetical protein
MAGYCECGRRLRSQDPADLPSPGDPVLWVCGCGKAWELIEAPPGDFGYVPVRPRGPSRSDLRREA